MSLGIVLDTSGSMAGNKIAEAQERAESLPLRPARQRGRDFHLPASATFRSLLQDWTTDRRLLSRVIDRVAPNGGTAMYDAVAEAVPWRRQGQFRKKALVVISDGNDTSSQHQRPRIEAADPRKRSAGVRDRHRRRRRASPTYRRDAAAAAAVADPASVSGSRRPRRAVSADPRRPERRTAHQSQRRSRQCRRSARHDRRQRRAHRSDSRSRAISNPATASIADELSKQYYLGYQASGKKDGRWHSIRVEVQERPLHRPRT